MESEKKDVLQQNSSEESKQPAAEGTFSDAACKDASEKKKNKVKSGKKRSKIKKIVGGFFTAIVVVTLVFFLVVLVINKATNKPYVFGYATYTIVSGSMEPKLEIGDVILVKKVNSLDDLKVGDIITYHGRQGDLAGKTVTHQILRIEGDKIVTRGIAKWVTSEDPAITFNDVIGKYARKSGFLTVIYALFLNKYGFLFIIIIPLLILLVVQIVNFRRACKMDKEGRSPVEQSAEEVKQNTIKEKEDEIRRKAIEEYLASKKRIEQAGQKKKNDK